METFKSTLPIYLSPYLINGEENKEPVNPEGLKELLSATDIAHDPWGACISLHFDIAAELWHRDADIPNEWQYEPGLGEPERSSDLIDTPIDVLTSWGNTLMRACDVMREKGMDY